MSGKISLYKSLYYSIILYILSTMTQDLFPGIPLNRISFFLVFMSSVLILFMQKDKIMYIFFAIIIVDLLLVHLMYDVSGHLLDYIYFIATISFLIFIMRKVRRKKLLKEFIYHENINKIVTIISVILTIVALITKTGYRYAWGGESYFVGYSTLTHSAASSLCLVGALILLVYCNKKFSVYVMTSLLILAYGIFETGARTYIVPAAILIFLYIKKSRGNKNLKFLIYTFVGVIAIVILSKSSIMSKFIFTNSVDTYNNISGIAQQTSGRSVFWAIDLKGYLEGDLFGKLFGYGHDYVYFLNKTQYNLEVWAHNDFIQSLVGGGLLTLFIYLYSMLKCIKITLINSTSIEKICLYLYWLFPAFFNGFYNYIHYFLSFVILVLLFESFNINIEKI